MGWPRWVPSTTNWHVPFQLHVHLQLLLFAASCLTPVQHLWVCSAEQEIGGSLIVWLSSYRRVQLSLYTGNCLNLFPLLTAWTQPWLWLLTALLWVHALFWGHVGLLFRCPLGTLHIMKIVLFFSCVGGYFWGFDPLVFFLSLYCDAYLDLLVLGTVIGLFWEFGGHQLISNIKFSPVSNMVLILLA